MQIVYEISTSTVTMNQNKRSTRWMPEAGGQRPMYATASHHKPETQLPFHKLFFKFYQPFSIRRSMLKYWPFQSSQYSFQDTSMLAADFYWLLFRHQLD